MPSGRWYFLTLWVLFLVPKTVLWLWVLVRAGRYGARRGDRHREETTVIDEPIRAIDPAQARGLNDG